MKFRRAPRRHRSVRPVVTQTSARGRTETSEKGGDAQLRTWCVEKLLAISRTAHSGGIHRRRCCQFDAGQSVPATRRGRRGSKRRSALPPARGPRAAASRHRCVPISRRVATAASRGADARLVARGARGPGRVTARTRGGSAREADPR